MKHNIKLIIMDMDGTLLQPDGRIHPIEISAIRRAQQAGIKLGICSGRLPSDISYKLQSAGLDDFLILAHNGAYLQNNLFGETLAAQYMDSHSVAACIEIFEGEGVPYAMMARDHIAMNMRPYWHEDANQLDYSDDPNTDCTYDSAGVQRMIAQGVCKFLYNEAQDEARLIKIKNQIEALKETMPIDITSTWRMNFEIMPRGINKGWAIAAMAKLLNIDISNIMAIGDYDNDIDMLKCAGYGVAMANGSEGAKLAAKYITKSNTEHGVAEAIKFYAFGEGSLN